jgi:RimJ/RimL family protein N-acetyltransferase
MLPQAREPIRSDAAAEHWLRGRTEDWAAGTGCAFAVVDPYDAVLGNVAVTGVDRRHDIGWVSYWTTAVARGRGVATRGVRALADWSFGELGLFRLELGHRTSNPASCAVAVRAGFRVEGLEREKLRYDGRRCDVELHARLASDPEITYPRLT